jgi:ppGpp synthetase/RelA/SpoT-type nucleotidyltranferase
VAVRTGTADREWLAAQVARYKRLYPRYSRYAALLQRILRAAADELAPLAIVQARPKSIASFAEKARRKRHKYHDPANQLTDLCGARVIARTRTEVEALSTFIKEHFDVDADNSIDASERLKPTEFGYRSTHYVVSFAPGIDLGLPIPASLHGLKAELQVRTTADHAWADFAHDLSYKGAFELPLKWQRDLNRIAAQLEEVDHAFTRIEAGLQAYASSYEAYLGKEQLREEIETLEAVLDVDRENVKLAARIGKLAITVGDWDKAIEVLSRYVDPDHLDDAHEPLLRDLGIALCKRGVSEPSGPDYRLGQHYLEQATLLAPRDTDALASLAGSWRDVDDARAHELLRRAFEIDPTDPYPLGSYLEYEVQRTRSAASLAPLRPVIDAAIARCREQAEVGINVPFAFFGMARLHLLLGEPYPALRAYAKGIQASTADFMIGGPLRSLAMLSVIRRELPGHEWARRLLLVGRAARFPSPETLGAVRELAARGGSIDGPVVIVVGGTDPRFEARMRGYRELLLAAFADFRGTVISGGTEQGVSGLIGEVSAAYGERIHSMGYLPRRPLPADATVDRRYDEIRRTDGTGFSPLEPLQNWIDLLAAGLEPTEVKMLGINGGQIAALEYRIGLALGASVGVIEETGREAARLFADEQWADLETMLPLPPDAQTVRAFIGSGTGELTADQRDTIARRIHEAYLAETSVARLPPWDTLDESFRDANRLQADHIFAKLRQIGCTVHSVTDRRIALMEFTDAEVETVAEMEHGRWNAERLAHGWRWGPARDDGKRRNPYLVSWAQLPDDVKTWDRSTVRRIPQYLAEVGLEVRRGP